MSNVNIDSVEMLNKIHEIGLEVAELDFIRKYREIESKVDNNIRIQTLLKKLKETSHQEYTDVYNELMSIPIFTDYIDLQNEVQEYLKDVVNIFVKAISPNITVNEPKGGCSHCSGC